MKTQQDTALVGLRVRKESEDGPATAHSLLVSKGLPAIARTFKGNPELAMKVWFAKQPKPGVTSVSDLNLVEVNGLALDDLAALTAFACHGREEEDWKGAKKMRFTHVHITTNEFGGGAAELILVIKVRQRVAKGLVWDSNLIHDGAILTIGQDWDAEKVALQLDGADDTSVAAHAGKAFARELSKARQEDQKSSRAAEVARLMALTGKKAKDCIKILEEAEEAVNNAAAGP